MVVSWGERWGSALRRRRYMPEGGAMRCDCDYMRWIWRYTVGCWMAENTLWAGDEVMLLTARQRRDSRLISDPRRDDKPSHITSPAWL
jgi:hypothetical protein